MTRLSIFLSFGGKMFHPWWNILRFNQLPSLLAILHQNRINREFHFKNTQKNNAGSVIFFCDPMLKFFRFLDRNHIRLRNAWPRPASLSRRPESHQDCRSVSWRRRPHHDRRPFRRMCWPPNPWCHWDLPGVCSLGCQDPTQTHITTKRKHVHAIFGT